MQGLDDIPTLPNSPAQFAEATHSPSPALSLSEWSEIDMMSSIESLAVRPLSRPLSEPPHLPPIDARLAAGPLAPEPHNAHAARQPDMGASMGANARTQSHPELSPNTGPDKAAGAGPEAETHVTPKPASPAAPASVQDYGFIMPSLPQITYGAEEPVVGQLRLAVAGAKGKQVLAVVAAQMFDDRCEVKEDGIEAWTCSSSATEHGNVVLLDANFVPKEVPKWLESQLQRDTPIDAVIYTLASPDPEEEDVWAMQEIQKLAELVVVVADSDSDANVVLDPLGISSFHKRAWHISTQFDHNWDMHSSCVEAAGYRSMVPTSDKSELKPLVSAVLSASGRIRATASMLQAKWFQSQLVVTLIEPSGALAHHVNLRQKTQLSSIGNIDPLGLAHWSSIPRVTAAIVAGFMGGIIAALGASSLLPSLFTTTSVPPPKRHVLLDVENWPQWLI